MSKTDPMPETAIKRLRRLAADCVGPPSAATGTELALMRLRCELTEGQFEAAQAALQAREAYLRAIQAKQVKGASLEPASPGKSNPDPDSAAGRAQERRDLAFLARYERYDRVLQGFSSEIRRDFEDVVYNNLVPSWIMKHHVQRVAEALRFAREQRRRVRRMERERG